MPRIAKPKTKPRTPEEQAAYQDWYAQLSQSTDIAILAGVEAIRAGGDEAACHRAQAEALEKFCAETGFDPDAHDEQGNKVARPSGAVSALAEAVASLAEMPIDAMPRLPAADGWTDEKMRRFLTHLAEQGCISHACDAVGLSRQSAYALRRRHPRSVFAIAWDTAIDMARQKLLDEATERALAGREVAIWYHGEQVGTRIVHNDRLLMFLLSHKRQPVHPVLDTRALAHLFPAMLRHADTILPPDFDADRVTGVAGDAADTDP